jgi:glycosyltransferase involved in cell wall biosynthesis
MSKALYVAFPSRHDEMCLWSLEALAGGLPMVAFDLPESYWMTKKVSMKAKRFNIDEYAQMLLKATETKRITQMRRDSRIFAKQFTWENVLNDYEPFFYDVLAREGTKK